MKEGQLYFKSDGNGGYNIGKYTIAILTVMLLLAGMIIPQVFAYGKLNNKVDTLTDSLDGINDVKDKNVEQDIEIAVINTKLDQIIEILTNRES